MNKSIVTFTRGTLAQATPLWQYDYGQVLEINGLDLPATYQAHFCNCSDTQTITVLGNADGVLIPDNLLQTGKTVIAYIYLHTGADDGETEYKITIPVRPRPAPSDIPPTPEQQSALDEAITALNSAVEDVEDIASGIPDQIDSALAEAKASGEFDGPPGPQGDAYVLTAADREEIAGIASDDVLIVSDEEPTVEPLPKIWIDSDDDGTIAIPTMEDIGDLSDLVTTAKDNLVAAINEAAQSGGGGGTGDYADLTNQPQINGTTLSGNKTAAELGLEPEALIVNITQSGSDYTADKTYQQIRAAATEGKRVVAYLDQRLFQLASVAPSSNAAVFVAVWQGSVEYIVVDVLNAVSIQGSTIGNYSKPVSGIPASDLASGVIPTVPTKTSDLTNDSGFVNAAGAAAAAPVQSVNGQTGAVTVPEPFVVTYSTSDMTTWTCDKTFAQIASAMAAGKQIVMVGSVGGTPITQGCDILLSTGGNVYYIEFWIRWARNGWYRIEHDSSDSITVLNGAIDSDDVGAIEAPASANVGDFLVYTANGWAAQTLSTWQGGSY